MSFPNLLQSSVVIKKIGESRRRLGKLTEVFRDLKKFWEIHIMDWGEMQEMKGRRMEKRTWRKSKKKEEDTLPINLILWSVFLFVLLMLGRRQVAQ